MRVHDQMQTRKCKHPSNVAGGGLCIQQVASNTIKVLNAQDTPHFTFDAVLDMSVQQEGVFAGQLLSYLSLVTAVKFTNQL